jgi:protein tyrosine phosphatase (PTP) superfamily phosphohydrolase (DUF442 family)
MTMPARKAMIWAGRRKKWPFVIGALLGAVLVSGFIGVEAVRVLLGENLHVVLPGQVYRGAQRSPDDLEKLVKKLGIRTVVNLRGLSNPAPWYLEQSRRIQKLGISQFDVSMSAGRLPSTHELRRLVEILDRAEYPIYFHCRRGADRTGLASVVAKLVLTKCGWQEGRSQLSWRYGHVAIGRLAYIDEFFDFYTAWLEQHGRQHSNDVFRHWILHEYQGGWCSHEVEDFGWSPGSSLSAEKLPMNGTRNSCVPSGEPIAFHVRLRNTGLGPWNVTTHSRAGFHLGYRVWDMSGKVMLEGRSHAMEESIAPGAVLARTVVIPGELPPGRYRVMIDMVDESLGWFYQMGAEPMETEIDVCE